MYRNGIHSKASWYLEMMKVPFVCFDWPLCFTSSTRIYVVWIGCKAVLFGWDIDGWSALFVYVSEHTSLTNRAALYSCCCGLCAWEIVSRPKSWHFYFIFFNLAPGVPHRQCGLSLLALLAQPCLDACASHKI